MDVRRNNEKRKRKRKATDGTQIQYKFDDEPPAKRQKITIDLPAELLFGIFSYCDPTEMIIIGRVCKFWNECAAANYRWCLLGTAYKYPSGTSWGVENLLPESTGFIKADIKYVAPKHNVLAKEIHSIELYCKREYLARYGFTVGNANSRIYTFADIADDFFHIEPESTTETWCWALEARLLHNMPGLSDKYTYQIAFSVYFNEVALVSALSNHRKFPKKEIFFKHLQPELRQIHVNIYQEYWSGTTHPYVPSPLVDIGFFGGSVAMFEHQREAISWMLHVENLKECSYSKLLSWSKSPNFFFDVQNCELVHLDNTKKYEVAFKPKGGILADDFGFGKTISAICLVLADKKMKGITVDLPSKYGDKFFSKSTLVICPVNLINQWEDEIAKFKELSMTVLTNPNEVLSVDTDFVLVSDLLLQNFFANGSVLFNIHFRRIILDESHTLLLRMNAAIQALSKTYAWCISATPFQLISSSFGRRHSETVLPETISFLEIPSDSEVSPLNGSKEFKSVIEESGGYFGGSGLGTQTEHGAYESRFNLKDSEAVINYNRQWLLLSTLLWCTKRGSKELSSPPCNQEIVRIDLTPFEQALTDMSLERAKKLGLVAGVGCYSKTLDELKDEETRDVKNTIASLSGKTEFSDSRQEYLERLESIPYIAADPNVDTNHQMINVYGSKIATVVNWLRENIILKNEKCIVFSRFPVFLGYIGFVLEQCDIPSLTLTKFMNDVEVIKTFKNAKKGILLMELNRDEFSGIYFNDVNCIIFLDLLSQAFLQEDANFRFALERAVHIGRDKSQQIRTVRFIINNSIDEELFNAPDDNYITETSFLGYLLMNQFNKQ